MTLRRSKTIHLNYNLQAPPNQRSAGIAGRCGSDGFRKRPNMIEMRLKPLPYEPCDPFCGIPMANIVQKRLKRIKIGYIDVWGNLRICKLLFLLAKYMSPVW
jgi:hypothetical protein